MSSSDPISFWIAQLEEGRHTALPCLLDRYFQRLVRLARARLKDVPGLASDEGEVVLSAFKSLCLRLVKRQLQRIRTLWAEDGSP